MGTRIEESELPGVWLAYPDLFGDERGFFMETYQRERYAAAGVAADFIQDNLSRSRRGTLRGLHYQLNHPQGKLVTVFSGCVLDVAVDIRRGSPTFGKWTATHLDDQTRVQMYIPPGFAHGFCVLSEQADFYYKCTDVYVPDDQFGMLWSDPDLGIDWGIDVPILSEKDRCQPRLAEIPDDDLPVYGFNRG